MEKNIINGLELYIYLKTHYKDRLVFSDIVSNTTSIVKGTIDEIPFKVEYINGRTMNISASSDLREEIGELLKKEIREDVTIEYFDYEQSKGK